ncbi:MULTISPECIES: EVE domain-containing protein [Niallia]|uniref:EVE domain-containing protein n=1 Tax=Niallia hominis TaxID=3133173 RepID=A0ABV1F633_9BACI|nr:EVE domain-containing protein [Niallia sp. MER TA 168]MCM3364774.1 EVE domain-containing protein [Niallia sp. MER TA 168]
MHTKKRFWIGIASRDHVLNAVQGGFAQLCHGKLAPLRNMSTGDWIIYYSPKINFKESAPHQKFTAIGRIIDEDVYQVNMGNDFVPFRRNIDFFPSIETPIKPLIPNCHLLKIQNTGVIPFDMVI